MHIVASKAFSLEPSKLVLYTRFDWMTNSPDYEKKPSRHFNTPPVKKEFHDFTISPNAYRNLRRKINWLYTLSKKKDITTWANRKIFAFRCSFITFTLPSAQVHPTSYITKEMFNNLLVQLRKKFGLNNYVWRLEFQKNGNVHYHLITDSFIEWRTMRDIWNGICSLHGYLQPYTEKHLKMNVHDYIKAYSREKNPDRAKLAKAFYKGKASGWKDPNSVDAKSVVSSKAVAAYISKYFSKRNNTGPDRNGLDTPENSKGLRLWYCSQSLSKLKSISDYLAHVNFDPETIIRLVTGFKRVATKYAILYFFDIEKCSGWVRSFLQRQYRAYAKSCNYSPT